MPLQNGLAYCHPGTHARVLNTGQKAHQRGTQLYLEEYLMELMTLENTD